MSMRGLACLVLVACAADGDPIDDPQLPPRGHAAIAQWLDAGYYLAWRCQPSTHEAMAPSPHPSARICSNDKIYETSAGLYPEGAATVKELYDGTTLIGHAVTRKLVATWYWYEAQDRVLGDGESLEGCESCHGGAPRDFVWTTAP